MSQENTDTDPMTDPLLASVPVHEGCKVLGGVRLVRSIGRGGVGAVYLGRHLRLDVDVAVKVLAASYSSPDEGAELVAQFVREARTAAAIRHQNLVRVLDVGQEAGLYYIIMEYVEGKSAGERLSQDGGLAELEAVSICLGAARGLARAHEEGIIHLDVKPDNILINTKGEVVVIDLGLARAFRVRDGDERQAMNEGASGRVWCTPHYVAPESLEAAEKVGPPADVWALGVTLYELLTASPPWDHTSLVGLCDKIRNEPLPNPMSLRPELSARVCEIIDEATRKNASERYRDCSEMARALQEHLTGLETATGVAAGSEWRVEPSPVRKLKEVEVSQPSPGRLETVKLVDPLDVHFGFVGYGTSAPDQVAGSNVLYLDTGNDLRPGVLDHHTIPAYIGSTTSLVLLHPDFVARAVRPSREAREPFTILLHEDPDLDCMASAYLATCYLTGGDFPDAAQELARYVDRIDSGYGGVAKANPFSLYSALMYHLHRLALRKWESRNDLYQQYASDGLRIVDHVLQEVERTGMPLQEVDAFASPGQFGPQDRRDVEEDPGRYRAKLADPRSHARIVSLQLPRHRGGTAKVAALLVRDVQNDDDPDRVVFFKDWARTDEENAPGGEGFAALSVFSSALTGHPPRCILSVTPESGVNLRGLGERLEQAETEARIRCCGVDDRVTDAATGQKKPPRPGYANADPWYDGRAHAYTIVDSPYSGTRLTAEVIEEILIDFGQAETVEVQALSAPLRPGPSEGTLRGYSYEAMNEQSANANMRASTPPEILISYAPSRKDWVEENLVRPLAAWRCGEVMSWDPIPADTGIGWFARTANDVKGCKAFVPVYCTNYFACELCQWVLQLALVRDPVGLHNLIFPVRLEPAELPDYCRSIKVIDAGSAGFFENLRQALAERLEG